MNKIKFIILLNLLSMAEQLFAENSKDVKSKRPMPIQQHIEQKALVKKSNNKSKSENTKKSDNQQKSNSQIEKLIQDFVKTSQDIPKKEEQPKRKSGSEKTSESQSKDINKKYHEAVEKAYQAYKKLHEYMKKNPNMTVTKEQDEVVKKSAIKLFHCKNVQNMAWKPHVQGQSKK